jgi:hypothetical protein
MRTISTSHAPRKTFLPFPHGLQSGALAADHFDRMKPLRNDS